MKCHYEVLGIPRTATVDDVKKSYRKLALEWHPDKNLHRTEEATETFQLIQQAYEVLVDPQERAWYDRNRDKILRGDEEYMDDQLDVYQYFNSSRFKGYDDDEKSFYTVYREVFEKIIAEDRPFMDDDVTVPGFGYSYSPYKEEVYPFYAYWQSYCTAKPYTWADKYDLVEARRCGVGRHALRCMERENKKLREVLKKTRNEEIRQLVAFVKKRDKRIEEYKKFLEKQNAEKARKAEEQRRKQIAERKKHLEQYKETEWVSMSSLESHLTEIEAHLDTEFGAESSDKDDDSSASDVDDLYCIACDKAFRSTKAMTNHQKSKKHRENVASLKEYMEDEDEVMTNLDENVPNGNSHDESLKSDQEKDICDEPKPSGSKRKKKKKKKLLNCNGVPEESVLGFNDFVKTAEESPVDLEFLEEDSDNTSGPKIDLCGENITFPAYEDQLNTKFKNSQRKTGKTVSTKPGRVPKQKDHNKKDPVNEENSQSHLEEESPTDLTETSLSSEQTVQHGRENTVIPEEMKKFKTAQRKSKKKAAMNIEEQTQQVTTTCVKCGKVFGSRNKLFDHLKETGHSTFLSDKDRETLKLKKKKDA